MNMLVFGTESATCSLCMREISEIPLHLLNDSNGLGRDKDKHIFDKMEVQSSRIKA